MSTADTATLPPDLARKVLGADLRNIVKKAGEGQTLTAQERAIVRTFLAEKVEPEELLESRRNALLQMWASGKKLSPEEFAEVADFLPSAPQRFALEPDDPGRNREGRYPQPLLHYAEFYQQTDRTIKRWIGKGRKATPRDFPPLVAPELMPGWYSRHHKQAVPEILLTLAAKARETAPPPAATEPATPATETPSAATYRPPAELPEGSGFEAELSRVRAEARKAAAVLEEAEGRGVISEIDAARRQYDRILKLLREYERDAPKILAATGNLVDRTLVEALLLPKHAAIRADFEAMYNAELHRSLREAPDFESARRVHLAAIHRVLRALVSAGFGDESPFALEAA